MCRAWSEGLLKSAVQPTNSNTVPIGIGELYVTDRPDAELVAYGLGSCVGVILQDKHAGVGGMVHVVLPTVLAMDSHYELGKYADTGVRELVNRVTGMGADRSRLRAKIAGGARMFDVPTEMPILDIGLRNTEAVRAALQMAGVPLVAEHIGGSNGRTMRYLVGPGRVFVRIPGSAEFEL